MKQILFLLCCLELLFATYLINTLGPYVSSVLLFSISVGIGIVYLKISAAPESALPGREIKLSPRITTLLQWAVFTGITYFIFAKLKHLWWYEITYPNPKNGSSDVIPQITTLVQRFLRGEQPYYNIPFAEYDLYPTYLPLQWLPYIPLEIVHKDYRWVPTFAMWFACFYYFLIHRRAAGNTLWSLAVPYWPMVVWTVFILHDNGAFVYTVEGLIAAYYFFVAESIKRRNALLLAIAISVCLMSRYSIIFWVPLCLALHFMAGKRRDALLIAGMAAVFFIGIYWFPFLRKDPRIFINGYNYHTNAALAEWMRDLAKNNGSANLFNGLGFTPFALKLLPGNEGHILMLYKNIHLIACALCVIILALVYRRHKAKYPLHAFLLFSFKIYLTIFYVFIQIPYKYLFFVPFFVSVSLLGEAYKRGGVKEKQTFVQ